MGVNMRRIVDTVIKLMTDKMIKDSLDWKISQWCRYIASLEPTYNDIGYASMLYIVKYSARCPFGLSRDRIVRWISECE